MSRRIHILFLLYIQFYFVPSALGQDLQFPEPFISEIELFAGPSLSFLRGNPSVDNNRVTKRSAKLGFTAGLGLTHKLNENFSMTGAFMFERKGSIAEFKNQYFDESSQTFKEGWSKYEYVYDYYTLTFFAGYTVDQDRRFKVSAGCFAAYLDKQIVRISHYPQGTTGISNETAFNTSFDFGLSVSISYRLHSSRNISFCGTILNNLGWVNTRLKSYYANGTQKTNNTNFLFGAIINKK
jgi:hypothetical protein